MPQNNFHYRNDLVPYARKLRKEMTRQERHLWYDFLRAHPIKFYRQRAIAGYIVDFYCAPAKLAIELDGSQHFTEEGLAYDTKRTNILEQLGILVIRFSNEDVDKRFDIVCDEIHQMLIERME